MGLHPDDKRKLEAWWAWCWMRPGHLPADLELVQQKIVRAVGRGELPRAGAVYVKAMWFPRAKDKLRYAFRALPGLHEAQMLECVRKTGIPCPEVLFVWGRRLFLAPRLSLLVVRDLHPRQEAPEPGAMIAVAARLADAGIFHPDLNPGNFLALAGGDVAVLDLQSARQRSGPVARGERLRMAAKLLSHLDPEAHIDEVVESGLLHGDDRGRVLDTIDIMRRRWQLSRIHRCFQESTSFSVSWRWNGTLMRRKRAGNESTWMEGGDELIRYWIGDRSREVLTGQPPLLNGLFRRWRLLPGKHKLYIATGGEEALQHALPRLLEGHAQYLELLREGR